MNASRYLQCVSFPTRVIDDSPAPALPVKLRSNLSTMYGELEYRPAHKLRHNK